MTADEVTLGEPDELLVQQVGETRQEFRERVDRDRALRDLRDFRVPAERPEEAQR